MVSVKPDLLWLHYCCLPLYFSFADLCLLSHPYSVENNDKGGDKETWPLMCYKVTTGEINLYYCVIYGHNREINTDYCDIYVTLGK
jgi:hypothetical protein